MWPSRLTALLAAFAWEAAECERAPRDLHEALGSMFGEEE